MAPEHIKCEGDISGLIIVEPEPFGRSKRARQWNAFIYGNACIWCNILGKDEPNTSMTSLNVVECLEGDEIEAERFITDCRNLGNFNF